jgi:MFS transporter, LPLT family, lysophospholipid transporter
MQRGFYTIMAAQFFSSLADNALFIAALQLLKDDRAPEWQQALLIPTFAFFYVVLAPFVGAIADRFPKGNVMLVSNAIKVVGCTLMLFDVHPLIAYAVVGLGAAAYSPAKYGILTELLPASQLVKANGWIEGLTIGSIILGVLLGGFLIGPRVGNSLLDLSPFALINEPAEAAIASMVFVYALAAAFNYFIPRTSAPLQALPKQFFSLISEFQQNNLKLWRDKLGQISLATTTLFWGVAGNLRYIVLAWAAAALGYTTSQATNLTGVVAIGTAIGAVVASTRVKLDKATGVITLGIIMGILIIGLIFMRNLWLAVPFLILLGGLGGYLVVPMNALLQHRGHNLMGAGRSIAVQNFNEQACILGLGLMYSSLIKFGVSAFGAITIFGLLVAGTMYIIGLWHKKNLRDSPEEVEALLAIARNDNSH